MFVPVTPLAEETGTNIFFRLILCSHVPQRLSQVYLWHMFFLKFLPHSSSFLWQCFSAFFFFCIGFQYLPQALCCCFLLYWALCVCILNEAPFK